MAGGIIGGIVLVILGIMLISIGSSFYSQTQANQSPQTPATQVTNGFGFAFVVGGAISFICGIIVVIGSFGSFGGGGGSRY